MCVSLETHDAYLHPAAATSLRPWTMRKRGVRCVTAHSRIRTYLFTHPSHLRTDAENSHVLSVFLLPPGRFIDREQWIERARARPRATSGESIEGAETV